MKSYIFLLSITVAAVFCGCSSIDYPLPRPSVWNCEKYWYQDTAKIDQDKVDVFYVAATDIISSKDDNGKSVPLARLTEEECNTIKGEYDWFRRTIYTEEFNFFAPFYHQVTFESLGNPHAGHDENWDAAAQEVCEAFDYYMAHWNNGRKFILAGFSQGASILRAILKHMTDEQYSRLIAAYSIGFQVTAEDLKSPHIRPAQNATDQGVIISFNSVSSPEGIIPFLCADAACSINPVNWRTDATPAEFEYKGAKLTATLDTEKHIILIKGFQSPKTAFSGFFPEGNLHVYDRKLYAKQLKENALLRARNSMSN